MLRNPFAEPQTWNFLRKMPNRAYVEAHDLNCPWGACSKMRVFEAQDNLRLAPRQYIGLSARIICALP